MEIGAQGLGSVKQFVRTCAEFDCIISRVNEFPRFYDEVEARGLLNQNLEPD
jgi:hypothetical protein